MYFPFLWKNAHFTFLIVEKNELPQIKQIDFNTIFRFSYYY